MKHALRLLFFAMICAGCSSLDSQEKAPNSTKTKAAVEPDEISFWQDYPTLTYELSDDQILRLREIVQGCEMVDMFSGLPEGTMVSPAQDLSSFTLSGEIFLFCPPSNPGNFRLSAYKKRMLHDFMASEFGITKRWERPKPKKANKANKAAHTNLLHVK